MKSGIILVLSILSLHMFNYVGLFSWITTPMNRLIYWPANHSFTVMLNSLKATTGGHTVLSFGVNN